MRNCGCCAALLNPLVRRRPRLELEDEGRRTELCDALRAHTVPLSQADPPLENESFDDSAKRRTTLGIGDRRVISGLTELGGLLHLTGEPSAS